MPSFVMNSTIPSLIILELMLRNLLAFGVRKGGSMKMIQEAGFNGIVGTITVEEFLPKMKNKLKGGWQLKDILVRLKRIASLKIWSVEKDSVRRCYTGLTIAGRYRIGLRKNPNRQRSPSPNPNLNPKNNQSLPKIYSRKFGIGHSKHCP